MKPKKIILTWLAFIPALFLGFAFKPHSEQTVKIEIKDKTIVVHYTLIDSTHVTVNITDKNANQIEVIENTDDVQGSYKVTYKLTRTYEAGEYNVNVLFNGSVSCSKNFMINPKPKS